MPNKNTVTKEQINDILNKSQKIVNVVYDKCLLLTVQLENGFVIVESSSCVDKANFDLKIGTDICLERVTNKLWELEGYKLQCELTDK